MIITNFQLPCNQGMFFTKEQSEIFITSECQCHLLLNLSIFFTFSVRLLPSFTGTSVPQLPVSIREKILIGSRKVINIRTKFSCFLVKTVYSLLERGYLPD